MGKKILHVVQNTGPTNMGYNEFYLNMKDSSGVISLTDDKIRRSTFKSIIKFSINYFKLCGSYDVIHLHSNQLLILCWIIEALRGRIGNILYTVHTSFENLTGKNRFLFYVNFFLSHKVVFCSQSSFESFPRVLKICKKSMVIRNGVNVDTFSRGFHREGFVCLGRLIPLKRVNDVLDCYIDSDLSSSLTFIGSGVQYDMLMDKSKNRSNIKCLGQIERPDVLKELNKAKGIISYSSVEGMPVSILEGVSQGCIPILSDIPSHRELQNVGLMVFISDDVPTMLKNIKEVDGMSDNEYEKIIEYNYSLLLEKFSINSMLDLYKSEYEKFGAV